MASRMASEIWSAILSGCPSVTDSDVKSVRSRTTFSVRDGAERRPESGRLQPVDDIPLRERGQPGVEERRIAERRVQPPPELALRSRRGLRRERRRGGFDRDPRADPANQAL